MGGNFTFALTNKALKGSPYGFTLIELLVVVSIIGILSTIGISIFQGAQKGARDAQKKVDLETIARVYESKYDLKGGVYTLPIADDFPGGVFPAITPEWSKNASGADYKSFKLCDTLSDGSQYCRNASQGSPPINGGWSDWSACSVTTCGSSGTQTRNCNSPSPYNGGQQCLKADGSRGLTESKSCSTAACPPPCPAFNNLTVGQSQQCKVGVFTGSQPLISNTTLYVKCSDLTLYGSRTTINCASTVPSCAGDFYSGEIGKAPFYLSPTDTTPYGLYLVFKTSNCGSTTKTIILR